MSQAAWSFLVATYCAMAGCRSAPPFPPDASAAPPNSAEQRAPGSAGVVPPAETPPRPIEAPPRKVFRLSPASTALVAQARTQHKAGNTAVATATLERALRIEPGNPLLWLELARQNQDDGNPGQADAMARKALQLGTGDPHVQSAAWQVIADTLRARGRNQEAAEADRKAAAAGSLADQ